MKKGWVVAVEDPEGDLLYVVAVQDPVEAEDLVIKTLNLPKSQSVRIVSAATQKELMIFKLGEGDIRGPM